jgi:Tfp pilus assembly protein PilZ
MTDPEKYDPKSSVTIELSNLCKEISSFAYNATEEEKRALLASLKEAQVVEMLETWRDADRREAPRKPCSLTIYYTVEDEVSSGTMKNISVGGAFIETFEPLDLGQEITMTFWPAGQDEPIEMTGEIARADSDGIGVRFKTPPTEALKKMIEAL